jgi:hypothetical protein
MLLALSLVFCFVYSARGPTGSLQSVAGSYFGLQSGMRSGLFLSVIFGDLLCALFEAGPEGPELEG